MVHDPNDTRVHRRFCRMERKAGFLSANEEDVLAHACPDRIDGYKRPPGWLAVGREGLDDQKPEARQRLVLTSGDDVTDDTGNLH